MSVNWTDQPLTLEALREEYTACVRILKAERAMRDRVFGTAEPVRAVQKMAEIDRVLRLLEALKDIAKEHVPTERPSLFETEE